MNQKERYAYRKANNLCTYCGGPKAASDTGNMCAGCVSYIKEWNIRKRQQLRESGLCSCGKQPEPGYKSCRNCCSRSRKTESKRGAKGICYRCEEPVTDKHRLCSICRKKRRDKYHELKDEVFSAYGGYSCNCCKETIKQFLTIDHENNDGAEHRKLLGRKNCYRWLKENGFPKGFQVLCFNCNSGRQLNGGICPHKQAKS